MDLNNLLNTTADEAFETELKVQAKGSRSGQTLGIHRNRNETQLPPSPAETWITRQARRTNPPNPVRTPWHANGYTMPPIIPEVEWPTMPSSVPTWPWLASPVDSVGPKSPNHKPSSSWSSVGTQASALTQFTHSQRSSVSVLPSDLPDVDGLYPQPRPSSFEDQSSFLCLFTEACDTQSTARKAISHIFGRNKRCTRRIPDHIWVHFCRKHYQRSRYRNMQHYTLTQCELVATQTRRIHNWGSEKTEGQERRPRLLGWTVALRKRERDRLNNLHKRQRSDISLDCDDEALDFEFPKHAPAPTWLASMCRDGYSTPEVLRMLARIRRDVESEDIKLFPDIELLPQFAEEGGLEANPSIRGKRPPPSHANTIHKRSKSLGAIAQRTAQPDPTPPSILVALDVPTNVGFHFHLDRPWIPFNGYADYTGHEPPPNERQWPLQAYPPPSHSHEQRGRNGPRP